MYTSETAPVEFSSQLKSNVANLLSTQETTNDSIYSAISLRNRTVNRSNHSNLRFGELTFGKFFSKFTTHCISFPNFFLTYSSFYTELINTLSSQFSIFIKQFLKFNLDIKDFTYLIKYEKVERERG